MASGTIQIAVPNKEELIEGIMVKSEGFLLLMLLFLIKNGNLSMQI